MQVLICFLKLFLFFLHESYLFKQLVVLYLQLVKFLYVFSLFGHNVLDCNFFGFEILLELIDRILHEIYLVLKELIWWWVGYWNLVSIRGFWVLFCLFKFVLQISNHLMSFLKLSSVSWRWVRGLNLIDVGCGLHIFSFGTKQKSIDGFLVILNCLSHGTDNGCLRIST